MKRIIWVIIVCVCVAGAVFAVNTIENGKKTPQERRQQKEQEEQEQRQDDAADGKAEETPKNVIQSESRSLEYEFLDYEIIEDTEIEEQDTYRAEYFYMGEIPDADYLEKVVDTERAEKECPELREIWDEEARKKYTVEEVKEIYAEHIGPYISMEHPKTRYLFVKCRITNLREQSVEEYLNLNCATVSGDGTQFAYSDPNIYFDKPQHTEGEDRIHNFFLHNFALGETLECTLGYEIQQQYGEDEEYYIGFQPLEWDPATGEGAPDKEPRMVKLTDIGE